MRSSDRCAPIRLTLSTLGSQLPVISARRSSIACICTTAVAAMASHEVVKDKLGSEFVFVYCENKRQDHLAFLHAISPREYQWYL